MRPLRLTPDPCAAVSPQGYLGVELELNQALFPQREAALLGDLLDTLPRD